MNRKTQLMWLPSAGFGIGGIVAVYSGDLLIYGLGMMGFLGGAAVGYARIGTVSSALLSGLYGAVGFFVGFYVSFLLVLDVWEPPLHYFFMGIISGAISGAFIGLSLRQKKAIVRIGLGGALAFGAGLSLLNVVNSPIIFAVSMMIGGGILSLFLKDL